MKTIYLDYNATTPLDQRVLEKMIPYFTEKYGNTDSYNHFFGWESKEALESSRELIANFINANPNEIIFTSGATESINLGIKGFCQNNSSDKNHIISQVTEHKAVLNTLEQVKNFGWEITLLPVNEYGMIDYDELINAITPKTSLVVLMHANNEIGTIHDIKKIGQICKDNNLFFFTDVAQTYGKIDLDVNSMNIDLLSASAHKIYGPKGVGFLYARKKNKEINLFPLISGGGQEFGMRSGTTPVPLIVGLAEASKISFNQLLKEQKKIKSLRDNFLNQIIQHLPDTKINGSVEQRLNNNINLSFPKIDAESLLSKLNTIACSTGSACSSNLLESSYVLKSIGLDEELALSSIRVSFGRNNNNDNIIFAANEIIKAVKKIRNNYSII